MALLATAMFAPVATAGVPGPANCTVPAGIWLVGSKGGVPDPDGLFSVVIRDLTNAPIPNVPVDIEFNETELTVSTQQLYPGVVAFCGDRPRVRAYTDGTGTATFIIIGSAANRYTQAGAIGGHVRVLAAGTLVATILGAAYDHDGENGVDGVDIGAWFCDFASGQAFARSDYDFSGTVGANDLNFLLAKMSSFTSDESGPRCGDPAVPDPISLGGGLSLGWDDCRQLSSGADKSFACNTNSGTTFKLIASLTPRTDLTAYVLEAVIDVVNPAGALPDWWRFQNGGCRTTSLTSSDPNGNPSITCSLSGASQTTLVTATYPFNGDPNTERLRVTILLSGGPTILSADQTALLNLVINRAKTTGVGSCAGCNTPVDIVLRSMRVTRGDPCSDAPEGRPADLVFNASTGVNVAHWQSTTPTFPISVDATDLTSNPEFRLSVGPCVDGSVIQNFTVTPGTYYYIGCTVGQTEFQVDANGKIQYDPANEGLMTGAGTSTLTLHESTVTIDAHLAPDWTYNIDGGPCFHRQDIQTLILYPGMYSIGVCTGTCPALAVEELQFTVDGGGHVQYAPALEGAFNGAGTSTLVVKSFTFPSTRGNDVAPSMGLFRIVVEPEFWTMMAGYPGYGVVNGVHRLVSPTLYDPNTIIGRSAIHRDGDAADIAGVPVGLAGTIVSDSNMPVVPPGFAGPAGTAEVHTEIRSMNMSGGGAAVRAGTYASNRPISAGEIEGNPGTSGLFPAESFFDVFVEVDMPMLGTLYNSDPLLVENYGIQCFPPEVVYIHKHTGPVPILFKNNDNQLPQRWHAGDRLGWLVLAGHGMNFDANPAPANGRGASPTTTVDPFAEFAALVNAEPEMADPATLVVDVKDVVTFAAPSAFVQAAYRDSLENGINLAAALGEAGNPCAGLFEATRMYQRVDSLPSAPDWVTDQAVRRVLANRFLEMSAQLLAQANQSGGCPGTTGAPPKVLPSKLALLGIQPNPSFGRTTIRYALPQAGRVSLLVFDLTGRLVRTLVDGELPAGTYDAVWDGHQDRAGGRAVSSGAYFIQLSAGGKLVTQRMVLIR